MSSTGETKSEKQVIYMGMGGGGDTLAAYILSNILKEGGNPHIMGVGEHIDIIKKMVHKDHLDWTKDAATNATTAADAQGWEAGKKVYENILREQTREKDDDGDITKNVVKSLRLANKKIGEFLFREGLNDEQWGQYKKYIVKTSYGFKVIQTDDEVFNELKGVIHDLIQTKSLVGSRVRNPEYNTGWEELLISKDIKKPVHILTVIGGTNEKYGNSEGKFSIEVNKSKWDSEDIESELNKILKKFKNFQVNVRKGGDELKTIMIDVGGDIVRKFNEPLENLERDDIALRALAPVTRENNTVYVFGPGCDAHDDVDVICDRLYKAGFRRFGMGQNTTFAENLNIKLDINEEKLGKEFAEMYIETKGGNTTRANGIFSFITMNPGMNSNDFFNMLGERAKKQTARLVEKENIRKMCLHRTIWVNTTGFNVIDDKIQPFIDNGNQSSIEDYELEIIRRISIETTKVIENISRILVKAGEAEIELKKARKTGGSTKLLSKSGTNDWDKSKFYPEKQKIVEMALTDAKAKGKGENHIFYPKASRRVPMLDDNMGPTGWLLKHEKYGGDLRINLFNKNNSIIVLAKDYIYYRNRNISLFFEIYVEALKGKSKKRGKLSESIIEVFVLINKIIKKGNLDKDGLNDIGIGVLSFCQTWAKQNENGSMEFQSPQFSIMSPHFQTRFYINNLDLLKKTLGGEFPETEYKRVLDNFMSVMVNYNGSFVNIDELIQSLPSSLPSERKLENSTQIAHIPSPTSMHTPSPPPPLDKVGGKKVKTRKRKKSLFKKSLFKKSLFKKSLFKKKRTKRTKRKKKKTKRKKKKTKRKNKKTKRRTKRRTKRKN